jgi:hypothetical protein
VRAGVPGRRARSDAGHPASAPGLRSVVLALLALVVALVAAPVAAADGAPAAGRLAAEPPTLVVVGAPGLSWSDLEGRGDLPALAAVTDQGALGSLTVRAVRSRSCEVDGWLTLSSGRRAADLPGRCRRPLPVVDGSVPRWAQYLAAAATDSYDARPGTLGEAATASGACVETVGPGAAIAGADRSGRVSTHHATVPTSFACPLVVVDAGVLPAEPGARADAVTRLDEVVGDVLAAAGGADVVVAGTGDGLSPVRPRAVLAAGPSFRGGLLTSGSTRQPGLAQMQDITATALARLGLSADDVTGRSLSVTPSDATVAQRVAGRVALETRAATLRAVAPQVTGWLAVAYALWAVVVATLWWRRGGGPARGRPDLPRPVTLVGVAVATVPVSTLLANLVPWWRAPAPGLVLAGVLAALVAGATAAAAWAEHRQPLGALRLVAVVTIVALAGDVVLLGSRLQLASVFGQNPVVGGRFYGFGNTSFALYGLAVLVVVGWVAGAGIRSRAVSAALGVLVLLAGVTVEALPGADFGGPPGLLLGGLLVLALAAGVRLSAARVLVAVVGAVVLAALVAWLDWLRPAESRTHLGEFVQSVVSGDAGAVVGRKVAQNLANLGSPPLVVMSVATVALAVVAWRVGWRPVPAGAAVLAGAVVLGVVGFAVNDSGLVIPAFVAVVLAPLLVAASTPSHREVEVGTRVEAVLR